MGRNRERESFSANIARSLEDDQFYNKLYRQARLLDTPLLLRHVDEDVLNKSRLDIHRRESNAIRTLTRRSGDAEMMERNRDRVKGYSKGANAFDLSESVEKLYFDKYGEGFNGSPVLDKPGTKWVCPDCGMGYNTSSKLLGDECRICGHVTPIGRLRRDGHLRR